MKKKGFTLIELLAVIVILAIIAVITVPKIADMISSSRQGGAEDSFYGTLKAAELGYTKALQSNTNLKGSTCTIENNKITCTNGVNVEVSGKTPESGTLVIETDGSTIAKALTLNGYKCYGDLSTQNPCVKSDVDVASETLIKKVTTSGDGLYKDSYDETRYVFKGSSPNNYIKFNNENYRIVSVEQNGTIKIVKDEKLPGAIPFDARTNGTSGPRYNDNNTYCKRMMNNEYKGCNVWGAVNGTYVNGPYKGTVNEDATLNKYLNGDYYHSLNDKDKIQIGEFYTGVIEWDKDISGVIKDEQRHYWNGKVALLNVSDYLKASNNKDCENDFYTDAKGLVRDNYKCSFDNYIYKNDGVYISLLSPSGVIVSTTHIAIVSDIGSISTIPAWYGESAVKPAMYLKANLQLTGTGTSSDPYKIK